MLSSQIGWEHGWTGFAGGQKCKAGGLWTPCGVFNVSEKPHQ